MDNHLPSYEGTAGSIIEAHVSSQLYHSYHCMIAVMFIMNVGKKGTGKKGTGKKGTGKMGTEKRAQEKWAQEKRAQVKN